MRRRGRLGLGCAALALAAARPAGAQWCPAGQTPTAGAYNCQVNTLVDGVMTPRGRVGLACPSDVASCTGTPTTAGETCTLVDDACPAGCTRVPSEVEEWGAAAVRAWAGYTMVKCTENDNDNVVRRCDGVNDCAGGGGCTLADDGGAGVTSTCSSDEMDCGGLIGQVQANTVLDPTVEPTEGVGLPTCTGRPPPGGGRCPGVLAADATAAADCTQDGCTFRPACSETVATNCNRPLTMGNPVSLMVGSSLQSSWMVPYGKQSTGATDAQVLEWYSHAMCVTYGEIADSEPAIEMEVTNIVYAADTDAAADFAAFEWPEGTAPVTPVDCAGCTEVCCRVGGVPTGEPTDCCGSLRMEEDDGVTVQFVPPPNFVGSVAFDITLANPTANRAAGSILETATVQRSVLTTVGLPECMRDAAAVRRTPESFCGEHGVCRGPTGCACDSHWFGVRCDVESEILVAPKFVWRGWTIIFIVVLLIVGCCGFVWFANHTEKGKEIFGARFVDFEAQMRDVAAPAIPKIPERP